MSEHLFIDGTALGEWLPSLPLSAKIESVDRHTGGPGGKSDRADFRNKHRLERLMKEEVGNPPPSLDE